MNSQSQDIPVLYLTKLRCHNNKLANLKPSWQFWYGSCFTKIFFMLDIYTMKPPLYNQGLHLYDWATHLYNLGLQE